MPRLFTLGLLFWTVLGLRLGLDSPLLAAEKKPGELDLKTERVIIFKDGYALVIKGGTATANEKGEVYTDEVPDAAVLGSFWAAPAEGRISSMTAGWETTEETKDKVLPCLQNIEILQANKGKQAKVELRDKTVFSGVIQEVIVEKTTAPLDEARLETLDLRALSSTIVHAPRRVSRADVTESHSMDGITGANFVLRTEEGDVLLPAGEIRSLSIKEMKTTLTHSVKTTKRSKRLTFKVAGGGQRQNLTIMYFRPGYRWIPTYRIDLRQKGDKKIAGVTLQAELLNEAEDIQDAPIDIVVGVPNFRFRDTPSPLVLESTLRNALAEAAPQLSQQFANNGTQNSIMMANFDNRRGGFAGAAVEAVTDINLPGELTSGAAQDLFVYSLPKISLAKGQRAALTIFNAECPYKDVYTWETHVKRHDNETAPGGDAMKSPLAIVRNEVWHQIELLNNTNLPWTTGAALVMQGNQPLAQELLTYTSSKNIVRVPLTISVDSRGTLSEHETGRELKSLTWDNHAYAKITKEAKLLLVNNKTEEMDVEITFHTAGKATVASLDGKISVDAFNAADWVQYNGHPAVNNSSTVTWRLKVKPGEKVEPTVAYLYYIRHL